MYVLYPRFTVSFPKFFVSHIIITILLQTQMSNVMSSILENQAELMKEIKSLRKENHQLRQLLWTWVKMHYLCDYLLKEFRIFLSIYLFVIVCFYSMPTAWWPFFFKIANYNWFYKQRFQSRVEKRKKNQLWRMIKMECS